MLGLLVGGVVIVVVGLLAIAFGIPVKEFSFGNTLILSGVMACCTGVGVIAASILLGELKRIGRLLSAAGVPLEGPLRGGGFAPPPLRAVPSGFPAGEAVHPGREDSPQPPAWQDEEAEAERAAEPEQRSDGAQETVAPGRKRRNLLFMSSRRDRPQAADGATEETAGLPTAPAAGASFEDAWPAAERSRSDAPRQSGSGSRAAEPAGARAMPPPPIRRPAEAAAVTILKSGVVDGMAYSLYSDGSIEAQLPEGMIRFSSIDELRDHLDQRG